MLKNTVTLILLASSVLFTGCATYEKETLSVTTHSEFRTDPSLDEVTSIEIDEPTLDSSGNLSLQARYDYEQFSREWQWENVESRSRYNKQMNPWVLFPTNLILVPLIEGNFDSFGSYGDWSYHTDSRQNERKTGKKKSETRTAPYDGTVVVTVNNEVVRQEMNNGVLTVALNDLASHLPRRPTSLELLFEITLQDKTQSRQFRLSDEAFARANLANPEWNGRELLLATRSNDYDQIVRLTDEPYTKTWFYKSSKNNALMLASENGYRKIVERLLETGFPPNKQNARGQTALMLAVANNHNDAARLLIAHRDSDLELMDNEQHTALHHAIVQRNDQLVEALVRQGARLDYFDEKGYRLVDLAQDYGLEGALNRAESSISARMEADRLLLKAKARLQEQDYAGASGSFQKILNLSVSVPDVFWYHYGSTLFKNDQKKLAHKAISAYLYKTGTGGEFYQSSLELLNKLES